MFLSEPQPTQFDIHFSVGGIPVRVHPFFWLAAIILGSSAQRIDLLLIWVVLMFFSILIHELGHALVMRRFGESPRVVLYLMGGLAIADSPVWGNVSKRARRSSEQIIISAAGPAAQFLLAGIIVAVVFAIGGTVQPRFVGLFPSWEINLVNVTLNVDLDLLRIMIHFALFINIYWALLNLLPIYPLDGGQIARELFVQNDAWGGLRKSLILSILTGAGLAIYGITIREIFFVLMFGSLAFLNWQVLQQIDGRGGGFGGGRPW